MVTTNKIMENQTIEYSTLPLSASTTDSNSRAYGDHPVTEEQAGFELPLLLSQAMPEDGVPAADEWKKWGRWKRATDGIAWHFYCSDAKFESVLRQPELLIDTGAKFATEVNTSSYVDDPFPVSIAGLWRKRTITRVWQDSGISCFIDLNVAGWVRELVLEGVPKTHQMYATKYMKTDLNGTPMGLDAVVDDFLLADSHVDEDVPICFCVYGGGQTVTDFCETNGWLWLPSVNNRRIAEEG
ncbi:DUF4417 domain-containing protein [bacterium]|nr:DUF4417 domain-containing protein [bacterium]